MDIQSLVDTYETPAHVREHLSEIKVVLLAGISGAGKDTIMNRMLQDETFRPVVSHTTRAPRSNNGISEQQDVDYHFIDLGIAQSMLADGAFVEAKYVHGTIYGTSAAEVLGAGDSRIAITDIDVQGVAVYAALSRNIVPIFIVPPDYETWINRLSQRYATPEEFEAEWPKRRASALFELSHALEVPYYHFLINDGLDYSVKVVTDIAHTPDVVRSGDESARIIAKQLYDAIQSR